MEQMPEGHVCLLFGMHTHAPNHIRRRHSRDRGQREIKTTGSGIRGSCGTQLRVCCRRHFVCHVREGVRTRDSQHVLVDPLFLDSKNVPSSHDLFENVKEERVSSRAREGKVGDPLKVLLWKRRTLQSRRHMFNKNVHAVGVKRHWAKQKNVQIQVSASPGEGRSQTGDVGHSHSPLCPNPMEEIQHARKEIFHKAQVCKCPVQVHYLERDLPRRLHVVVHKSLGVHVHGGAVGKEAEREQQLGALYDNCCFLRFVFESPGKKVQDEQQHKRPQGDGVTNDPRRPRGRLRVRVPGTM
mmetsp:Transcript_9920/g.19238  ORF Transcript_9920/g.19238 Transcript_9920/m.19238 type:complete len:297 (-) Transcript_9920:224-1114(-)